MELKDFKPGQWVKIHPASDWFARGVSYATVTKVGRSLLTLDWHDGNGHSVTFKLHPRNVLEIL
jgi:hypothetical protein